MARRSRPSAATAPPPARGAVWPLTACVAVAIALRVAHVLALRATPWFDHLVVDPAFYDAWAQRLASGGWAEPRPFYMDPLYPYVLGEVYALVGHDLLAARLLNVALSGIACAAVGAAAWRVAGARAGWIAALGFALYAPEIFAAGEIDKTTLSVTLASGALALALAPSRTARIGAGAVLGLAALTRANFLLLAPAVALALSAADRRAAGGFLIAFALPLLPVAWHNQRTGGGFTVTTQAGQNFYTGNNAANPWGAYGAVPFVRPSPEFEEQDFRVEAERRAGRLLTPPEVSRFWFGETLRWTASDPRVALRTVGRKLILFWKDFEIADSQDQYLLARDSWVLALPLPGFGATAALALAGLLLAWRTRPAVPVLAGCIALYCASVVAFFVFARYRIQIVPALLVLAAVGAIECGTAAASGRWTRLATAAAAAALAAWFSFAQVGLFGRDDPRFVEMQLGHAGDVYFLAGQPARGLALWREAFERCPQCPLAIARLADGFVRAGRSDEGAAYFTSVLARPSPPPGATAALARVRAAVR